MKTSQNQKNLAGEANGLTVLTTALGLLLFASLIALVWTTVYVFNYRSTDKARIKAAEDTVRVATTQKLEAEFAEREKTPYLSFVAPDDLGRVAFTYPRTWNVFINKDSQPYEAYFNPAVVRPINSNSRYALRLLIEDVDYVKVLERYNSLIKSGKLSQSIVTVNGQQSTKLEGAFSDKITGTAVIIKIRDKTVTLRTDTDEAHKADFNKLVETITFRE